MIKCSIIGARTLAEYIVKWSENNDNVILNYIFDVDEKPARNVMNKSTKQTLKYTTSFEVIKQKSDCVFIDCDTKLKFDLVKEFLSAGLHVFVRPPISFDSAKATELYKISKEKGVFLFDTMFYSQAKWFEEMMVFNATNNPHYMNIIDCDYNEDINQIGANNSIGEFSMLNRGVLYTKGYRSLYLAVVLFGKIASIKSVGVRSINSNLLQFNGLVSFEGGQTAIIDASSIRSTNNSSVLASDKLQFYFTNLSNIDYFKLKYNSGDADYLLNLNILIDEIYKTLTTFIENVIEKDVKFFHNLNLLSIETIRGLKLIDENIEKIGEFKIDE